MSFFPESEENLSRAQLLMRIHDLEDIVKKRDETINELNYRVTMGLGYAGTLGEHGPTLGVQGPNPPEHE